MVRVVSLGDDVLFHGLLKLDARARMTAPVQVVEGSRTSAIEHAICDVVRRHMPACSRG
jgi:lipase